DDLCPDLGDRRWYRDLLRPDPRRGRVDADQRDRLARARYRPDAADDLRRDPHRFDPFPAAGSGEPRTEAEEAAPFMATRPWRGAVACRIGSSRPGYATAGHCHGQVTTAPARNTTMLSLTAFTPGVISAATRAASFSFAEYASPHRSTTPFATVTL